MRNGLLSLRDATELSLAVPGNSETFNLRIEYDVLDAKAGVYFYASYDRSNQQNVKYFQVSNGDLSRYWLPSVRDSTPSWDLEYQIHTQGLDASQISALNMASSGVMVRQFSNGDEKMKIFHFKLDINTPADSIAFAIGLFDLVKIPSAPFAIAFCPMGSSARVTSAMDFFSRAFGFVNYYLSCSNFPYPSYYLVFLRDSGLDYTDSGHKSYQSGANVSFFDTGCLFDSTIIDQNLETRMLLSLALVEQYFGVALRTPKAEDAWLTRGIVGYLARLLLRIFHGHNDFRYGLKQDMEAVMAAEANQSFYTIVEVPELLKPEEEKWFKLKSYLLFAILDHRLEKQSLQRILGTIWSEYTAGRLSKSILTTASFLRIAKKISGKDMRSFADHWIFQRGSPVFTCNFAFNRKKSTIEMDLKQYTPGNPTRKFTGSLLIRVHEVDGVFDHSVHIDDFSHHFELPVHAKAKKIKKKKAAPVEAAPNAISVTSATIQPPSSSQSASGSQQVPPSDGAVGGKEEEGFISPLSWIRLDPEMEWIATLELHQPEFMLVEALQHDKDVVSQHEAIIGLKRLSSDVAVDAFEKALIDFKLFYKIRIEAATALATTYPNPESHTGPLKLVSFYNKTFAIQSSETVVVPIPKANNFENLQNYFLLKGIVSSMSLIKCRNSTIMELAGQVLLNMMRFNDNSANEFSDNYHVANMITSFLNHLQKRRELNISTERLTREYLKELDRYMVVERIQPYYHNTTMVAIIDAWRSLRQSMEVAPASADATMPQWIKPGNYVDIRLAALRYLIMAPNPDVEALLLSLKEMMTADSRTLVDRTAFNLSLLSHSDLAKFRSALSEAPSAPKYLWSIATQLIHRITSFHHLSLVTLKFLDSASDDSPLGIGSDTRPILRIHLSQANNTSTSLTIKQHDLSSDADLACATGTKADEPDWFSELAGDQPTTPSQSLSKAAMSSSNIFGGNSTKGRLLRVHSSIWNNPDSFPFRYPVDPSVIGYYDIIKHPMDLTTLKKRLDEGVSASWQQFTDELRLMFDNCFFFNQSESLICEQARRLRVHSLNELKAAFPNHSKEIKRMLMTKEPVLTATPIAIPLVVDSPTTGKPKKSATTIKRKRSDSLSLQDLTVEDRMKKLWEKMHAHPYAFWFHQPVDPVAMNVPTYLDIIKEPMDLSTIKTLLEKGNVTPGEFHRLMLLMFSNSTTFNPSNTVVHQNSLEMQKEYLKQVRKFLPEVVSKPTKEQPDASVPTESRTIPTKSSDTQMNHASETSKPSLGSTSGIKLKITLSKPVAPPTTDIGSSPDLSWVPSAIGVLDEICKHAYAEPFLEPVDWRGLRIPQYPKIIRKPTDLSTIRQQLNSSSLPTPKHFHEEMARMFANCYKFNGPTAPISECARVLEEYFHELFAERLPK